MEEFFNEVTIASTFLHVFNYYVFNYDVFSVVLDQDSEFRYQCIGVCCSRFLKQPESATKLKVLPHSLQKQHFFLTKRNKAFLK